MGGRVGRPALSSLKTRTQIEYLREYASVRPTEPVDGGKRVHAIGSGHDSPHRPQCASEPIPTTTRGEWNAP
jgi:hypothetical protein